MSLSVVIPCSNPQQVPRTLESVLFQKRPVDEIVLVTCGAGLESAIPEEESRRIMSGFAGRLVKAEVAADASPADLWDLGFAESTSEWVSVITPGTTLRPSFASALAETAERSAEATLLRGGWTRERSSGGPPEQHTLLSVRTITHPAEALYEQRFGPKASMAAAAVRRSAWIRMGGVPPEINLLGGWIGDWALCLAAGALGDTVRSQEVMADIHEAEPAFRKSDELSQMYRIYRDVLPRAAAIAGLDHSSWIEAASKKRFRDVTIAASNELGVGQNEERLEIASALQEWAKAVDQTPLLARLKAGERIRSFALGKKMKPALRRVIAAVR